MVEKNFKARNIGTKYLLRIYLPNKFFMYFFKVQYAHFFNSSSTLTSLNANMIKYLGMIRYKQSQWGSNILGLFGVPMQDDNSFVHIIELGILVVILS